ncbi:MAG: GNAT family N-acyltransferase, partial [Gammaproteobacteria bacterium]
IGFLRNVLELFNIRYSVNQRDLDAIPRKGPVIIVANHPFGGLKGVILAHYLLQQRRDIRFMANYMLERVPELRSLFISVDPFGGASSHAVNLRSVRTSVQWVRAGGVLVVYPSGEVSHWHLSRKQITDPQWSPSVARLARTTAATVVPVYFEGSNSLGFQLMGLMHAKMRTMLLPRELLNKKARNIELTIGKPIRPNQVRAFDSNAELIRYLRVQTYSLARYTRQNPQPAEGEPSARWQPVMPAVDVHFLAQEIDRLPDHQRLAENGSFLVAYARSQQIPHALQEIGRLRGIAFRAGGEGTGGSSDLDRFDTYYTHLVLWDRDNRRIAGGYRFGLSQEIVPEHGKRGFYTQQLFRYRSRLLQGLSPCIELGRSFVALEYQKSYSPLMLLWKGIGVFVSRHPQYRVLFGPVSISADYQTSSQQLLVDFLKANRFEAELSRFVRPKKPFKRSARLRWTTEEVSEIRSLDRISDIVAQMECDDKGVPILLKQYLKLGGRLLGFNVDPEFNNALDGLIMVDLCLADRKTLNKYMGEEGAQRFLSYQARLNPGWRKAS